MPWSLRRKLLYSLVAGGAVAALAAWIAISFLSHPATCSDGIQDQQEIGVDCGGPCASLCASTVGKVTVLWVRALPVASSTYTAAAYIQNPNSAQGAGAYHVPYAFRLYDDKNVLVVERDGMIDIPPTAIVPVIEPNIPVGSRVVAHAFLDLSQQPSWQKIPSTALLPVRIEGQDLSQDGTRLSALVTNHGLYDARNLTLAAVLFDRSGQAVAASKSVVQSIAAGSSQTVVFTWSNPNAGAVRAEVTPLLPLPQQSVPAQ